MSHRHSCQCAKDYSGSVAFNEQDKDVKLLIMLSCYHVDAKVRCQSVVVAHLLLLTTWGSENPRQSV
jgi:hypothetical protein